MTEFKEINCQGIRLVLLWIPIGMDLLNPDLKRKKTEKGSQDMQSLGF